MKKLVLVAMFLCTSVKGQVYDTLGDRMCKVPDIRGMGLYEAMNKWRGAGFSGSVIVTSIGVGVVSQDAPAGKWRSCSETVLTLYLR